MLRRWSIEARRLRSAAAWAARASVARRDEATAWSFAAVMALCERAASTPSALTPAVVWSVAALAPDASPEMTRARFSSFSRSRPWLRAPRAPSRRCRQTASAFLGAIAAGIDWPGRSVVDAEPDQATAFADSHGHGPPLGLAAEECHPRLPVDPPHADSLFVIICLDRHAEIRPLRDQVAVDLRGKLRVTAAGAGERPFPRGRSQFPFRASSGASDRA
jgi:hypothetical protein